MRDTKEREGGALAVAPRRWSDSLAMLERG
ncbi:hypothetical protein FHR84_003803 [Actinopolyspora biskrensis]|uniref:DUF397 domain-containing protein n=1 Tax=Actinopolyspora biskrensis TaxID=1470178 RepID=A0A852ZA89_9ACTN|nr:hypothetical protein [Actinopolyspora biskrensis]